MNVADSLGTRDRLLQAGMDVFAERGYAEATTRAIAEAAGVNEVTLFRNFGSKADLMLAAFESAARTLIPALLPTTDVRADLLRFVEAYLDYVMVRGRFALTLLLELPRRPELQPGFGTQRRFLGVASQLIHSHQEAGSLHAGNPIVFAVTLVAPILMLSVAGTTPVLKGVAVDAADHVDRFLGGHAT